MQGATAERDELLAATLPQAEARRLSSFLNGNAALDDGDARRLADALKTAADQHWHIAPQRSVALADVIISLGERRGDGWTRALGLMAKGDATKFVGSQQAAWDFLAEAGDQFLALGDSVGWARTWIGRLAVAAQLKRLPEALQQAERAREIFMLAGERLRQSRLDLALGEVNWLAENTAAAEVHYRRALETALTLGENGAREARALYNNLGLVAQTRGDALGALDAFEHAAALARAHGEQNAATICALNIAVARKTLGRYRQALALLNEIQPRYAALRGMDHQLQVEVAECLGALNRLPEALALMGRVREGWLLNDNRLHAARARLLQATWLAELGELDEAERALAQAAQEFGGLGETGYRQLAELRHGQLALRRGQAAEAQRSARACAQAFIEDGRTPLLGEARLLEGEAALGLGEATTARAALAEALACAQRCRAPALRYAAHAALGRLSESVGRDARALRHYAAAEAVLDRVQRHLTVTLRPTFLGSRLDAQRARARLLLRQGRVAEAFEGVERLRAGIAQGYLAGRETLRVAEGDAVAAGLRDALDRLRGAHSALLQRTTQETPHTLRDLEREMRALTEQLHLRHPEEAGRVTPPPRVEALSRALGPDDVMLAYFEDGQHFIGFAIDAGGIQHAALDLDAAGLARAQEQLERNLGRALAVGAEGAQPLLRPALALLDRLGAALLGPLAAHWQGKRRIHLVPFGGLHALPFNLLRHNGHYLIELAELVTLPSASLLGRGTPAAPPGARVLADDHGGRLPDALGEAGAVRALFDGATEADTAATRAALQGAPIEVLHIAAHGAYRPDAPEFSHLALADGDLMTDDILALDMRCALVTLSACETGRGRVTAGDEALGVGWAFLYAGAGAVIASLWRVSDARTPALMSALYRGLRAGESKAAALRAAQRESLSIHPAFWGAFQLYGAPDALPSFATGRAFAPREHSQPKEPT